MSKAQASFEDGEGPAHQGLGLSEPVRGLQQRGQVVEADGDVGMVVAEGALGDGEGPAHQRLGLAESVRGLQQRGQVVEVDGDVGMVVAEAVLVESSTLP
jgi:hypothetical protein